LNHRRWVAPLPLVALVAVILPSPGCTGGHALTRRDTVSLEPLAWFSPARPVDRRTLDRWSAAVGPPVIARRESTHGMTRPRTLRIVSWNTAMGDGDVTRLIGDFRKSDPFGDIVLLLQEVFRKGPEVPSAPAAGALFASKLGNSDPAMRREEKEIERIAAENGLNLYYVPSMRNGSLLSDEDRGNAIMSTLPLSDFNAIELPFERQRRVAISAFITGEAREGTPWRLRLVSTHLDNMVGPKRGWFAGAEFARTRQVRGLLDYLNQDDTVVLGGDFNTWFGFHERAYLEAAKAFPGTLVMDRRPTFGGLLRLDHLFFRLPPGWRSTFRRAEERYGSDHFPLVATIDLP
jgi:endonuclease/exonuclease/phosphatase family metal-dependent hydrolase